MGVSPSYFRGRPIVTTILPPEGRDKVVRHVTSSQWTMEDRALMLAWRGYQNTLCSGCGFPMDQAWHPDNDWYDAEPIRCNACSAREEAMHGSSGKPVEYVMLTDTRNYVTHPLPDVEG